MNPTFGLEEEVFVVEPTRPSVQSLYYLSKLVWKNPKRYLTHTDSNFSRRKDILQGLMSGVEISTAIHNTAEDLIMDLKERRQELSEACEGLIVPLGHLLDYEAATNTCALQFHIGNLEKPEKTYANIIYFMPLLLLLAVNSAAVNSKRFGHSWRLLNSYAVGPLTQNWTYRFQDVIFAKRTGTIELRTFDPVWDISRIELLAKAIERIAKTNDTFELDIAEYNRLRGKVAMHGFCPELETRYQKLSTMLDIDKALFKVTPADIVWKHYQKYGLEQTYSALDHGYKHGKLKVSEIRPVKKNVAKILAGFTTYYIPKLPYDAWKYLREH